MGFEINHIKITLRDIDADRVHLITNLEESETYSCRQRQVVNVLVVRGAQGSYVSHRPGSGFARMHEIAAPVCQAVDIVQDFCGCAKASARDFWF